MPLPHAVITPIPNNEPDATPALWNTRYAEIDENFAALDAAAGSAATELGTARGASPSLDARLDEMEQDIAGTSVDLQNAQLAAIKFALDQAGLAHKGLLDLRQVSQQQGVLTIQNRGVTWGGAVTRSATATRNLSIAPGCCFARGREFSIADGENAASVPSNAGVGSATVFAYLYPVASGNYALAVMPIGSALPADAVKIYNLVIPAGNTDATDPNLAAVTLTDVRRIEAQWPQLLNSPTSASAVINQLSDIDYHLSFDVVSAVGAPCDSDSIIRASLATNGFTVLLASAADDVVIRWRTSRLSN